MSGGYLILRKTRPRLLQCRGIDGGDAELVREKTGRSLPFFNCGRRQDDGLNLLFCLLVLENRQPRHLVLFREKFPSLREFPFPVLVAHRGSPPRIALGG